MAVGVSEAHLPTGPSVHTFVDLTDTIAVNLATEIRTYKI